MRRRALTLIELLCVIAIIAILAALYFGVFPKVFKKATNLGNNSKGFNDWMKAEDSK
ncbi:MAG TPA: prepilin-type N-terminal cleavage/methylation domain-containing protein [Verrucomicrobiae bacterium]|jgi:prepilin-type N-terminal cleavage/methylation domain-containing protein|nr:prepilin-type N-terminal cleavage/methylation domain-containing protein [Verrucomicrobiae bacterium]